MVVVHVGDKNDARQFELIAQLPCLFRADLDACLAVYNNDRRISHTDCFFYFTDKVKITRGIQDVDLHHAFIALILDRDQ